LSSAASIDRLLRLLKAKEASCIDPNPNKKEKFFDRLLARRSFWRVCRRWLMSDSPLARKKIRFGGQVQLSGNNWRKDSGGCAAPFIAESSPLITSL
jgi:hypothetical protein